MNKFLVSAANVRGYDQDDNLIFEGKTMLNSSIETTIANTEVSAGQGNKLLYTYYHTGRMSLAIEDATWKLEYLGLNVGSGVTVGKDIFTEETVALIDGEGSVLKTPLALSSQTIFGWVTIPNQPTERIIFTDNTFRISDTTYTGDVCIRYVARDYSARSITIYADMIPSIIRLEMEAMLASSEAVTNKIGVVQIEVPKAQLTGAFTINMTPDGVASTPMNVTALAVEPKNTGGCVSGRAIYATITEIYDQANWYDNVIGLAVVGGNNISLESGSTRMLEVRAIPSTGSAFKPNYEDLTFTGTGVTVTPEGVITGSIGGGSVSVIITNKPSMGVSVNVTAP